MLRRSFLAGLGSLLLAPAIVKADALMHLRGAKMTRWIDIPKWCPPSFIPHDNSKLTKQQFPELHAWLSKCRSCGAHLSDDFNLGGSFRMDWLSPYDQAPLRLQSTDIFIETVQVPLISVEKLRRANGAVTQPGMVFLHSLNTELLKADSSEPTLPAEKQAWRDQWKFQDPWNKVRGRAA